MNRLDTLRSHLEQGGRPFGRWTDDIRQLVTTAQAARDLVHCPPHEFGPEHVVTLDSALAPLLAKEAGLHPGAVGDPDDGRHECPIDGCDRRVPFQILTCYPHWRLVPRDLQRLVVRLWRDNPGADYLAAREEAIGVVNAKIDYGSRR